MIPAIRRRPGHRATARAPAPGAALDEVADAAQRVAVLLAAGLDPLSALRLVDPAPPPITAAARCASPHEVPLALLRAGEGPETGGRNAWAVLAAAWAVAAEAGAPLAGTLERTAETLRALADADRQVDLALAGPLATARIVALLPLGGLGMGALIGADPVGVVLGTVPGATAAVLGLAALALGVRWNRRLVAAARENDPRAGLAPELLALAVAGGAAPDAALARVAELAERCRVPIAIEEARSTLDFAARAGVPVAALLRAEASRARRVALADALRRAALLGSRLLAPLAVCFLPAFVLLGVVPLLVGILRDTLTAF